MGFAEFLTIIFVILKVTGFICWSWWLVFIPVIITYGFILIVLILSFIIAGLKK